MATRSEGASGKSALRTEGKQKVKREATPKRNKRQKMAKITFEA